jgi:hypothetical protein
LANYNKTRLNTGRQHDVGWNWRKRWEFKLILKCKHQCHCACRSFLLALKVNIYLQNMYKMCIFVFFFVCAACLPASLIMHDPISELHAQWHWCLHFSMSLNSQRFLQFHPTSWHVSCIYECNEKQKYHMVGSCPARNRQ